MPNPWWHVAVTYDGVTVQFYIDGLAAQPVAGAMYDYGVATYEIGGNTIGGSTTKASFSGLLDQIQVYGRALSIAEIQALYLAGIPFFTGSVNVGGGMQYLQFPNGSIFGYYSFLNGGWMFHVDSGYEYVSPANGPGVYLWDLASGQGLHDVG